MPDINPSFMTFFFNDGTKETVQAFSFHLAIAKLEKTDAFAFHPFWILGTAADDPYLWDAVEKRWIENPNPDPPSGVTDEYHPPSPPGDPPT